MTVTQLAIQSFLSPHTDRGVSEDATRLRERISDLFTDLVQNVTLGASYREASSALEEAYQEHSAENWDGYGAKAISPASYALASRLLETLPLSTPAPQVNVEPDGEIALEWYLGPRKVFSVSVGGHGDLSYAGLFGRSTAYGTEFFGDELPQKIVENLDRLFSQET